VKIEPRLLNERGFLFADSLKINSVPHLSFVANIFTHKNKKRKDGTRKNSYTDKNHIDLGFSIQ
jgi:hypothetical protein